MHNLSFEKEKKHQETNKKNPKTTAKHKTNALLDLLFFPVIFF